MAERDAQRAVPDAAADEAKQWLILAVLCWSLVLVVAGNSAVNVALPTLVRELGATQTQLQWIVDAYSLVFAGMLLPAGALGDRFGRKRALQAGLVIFGGTAAWASLAADAGHLIAARALMGVGAAFIMPSTLSILTVVFPPSERGRAIAIWAGFAGAGAAIGPVLSGILLEQFTWPAVFLINLPMVAIALLAGFWLVPNSRDPQNRPLDPIGSILSVGGLGGVLYGIIEGPNHGWFDPLTLGAIVLGVAMLLAFAWWEQHAPEPMVDLSWFRIRTFTIGAATLSLSFFAFIGVLFIITQYFQFVLDYSPLEAGLAQLPLSAMLLVVSPFSARLVERYGPRWVVTGGLLTLFAGLSYLALMAGLDTAYPLVAPGLALLGSGIALSTAPSTTLILSALPSGKAGVGSAVNDVTRVLGASVGVAILGSVLTSTYKNGVAGVGLAEDLLARARDSVGAALDIAAEMNGEAGAMLNVVARDAFNDGFRAALMAGAVVAIVAAAVVFRFGVDEVAE